MPEDFEFPGRTGEGEVGLYPANLQRFLFGRVVAVGGGGGFAGFGEDLDHHSLEGAFEVRRDGFDFLRAVVLCLEWVAFCMNGGVGVFDGDVVSRDAVEIVRDPGGGFLRSL